MRVSGLAILASLGLAAGLLPGVAAAQTAPAAEPAAEDVIVVTGTRVQARSALDTPAPVDVVSAAQLTNLGTTELNQALSVALPSLNFPRPGLADGTDTVRPAQLRGLAPDQTLVLVNSKRRHTAALVNVNGTAGRGSAATDMNTIPTAMVQAVEVLRDGASAQYGSDAIAGVVNVRLRERSEGGGLSLTLGQRMTTVETLVGTVPAGFPVAQATINELATYDRTDGQTVNLNGWKGFDINGRGFLTVGFELLSQEKTVRTAPDWRQQYCRLPVSNNCNVGTFDPRETTINRYNAWYGEPDVEQYTLMANFGYDLDNGAELYGWAGYQNRLAVSGGFFRRAVDDRALSLLSIHPDGFLPLISPLVQDVSLGLGQRATFGNWDVDGSVVFGSNSMDFTIKNTGNSSMGATSPITFDAGGFAYNQLVANFTATRELDIGASNPLSLALGLEARREGYEIKAGSRESWDNFGVRIPFGSNVGAPNASGAQVFPGFRPANVIDEDRTAVSAFIDTELQITDSFLMTIAARAESYSDFGETATGKVAARWDVNDFFAIRGSVQNGFRAPSLQQQFFTATSTNFISGVPFDITTFPATSPQALALGASALEPEESINGAIGVVIRAGGFNLTIDAYQINIDNRIVLSENLTQVAVRNFLTSQGFTGIGGGRFFINGVDTETSGVDIIGSYRLITDTVGTFNFTLGANFNETSVTRVPITQRLISLGIPTNGLFARNNVLIFEEGTPSDKYSFSTDWSFGAFGATLRATRYGEVLSPDAANPALDLVLEPRTLVDLEGRYKVNDVVAVAIGADNITDEYPTQTPATLNTTSNTPFSNLSPFGRSGRYVYARITMNW